MDRVMERSRHKVSTEVNGRVYEGEVETDGIRLPKKRSWYNHADGKRVGIDAIVRYTRETAQ